MKFKVIDVNTGKYPNLRDIAKEDWAKDLMWMDMDGFALTEEGSLLLMDECGNSAYCPQGRFEVITDRIELYVDKEDIVQQSEILFENGYTNLVIKEDKGYVTTEGNMIRVSTKYHVKAYKGDIDESNLDIE